MTAVRTRPGPRPGQDDGTYPYTFGAAVRVSRLRAGLTQRRLADQMALRGAPVDARTIGAWEQGPQEPRPGPAIAVLERVLGLQPDLLLVRLGGRSRDPEAFDLRQHLCVERLNYVTTALSQHVMVGTDGRVAWIETTQRVRALVPNVSTCVFAHTDDPDERVRVEPVTGCVTDYWWPPVQRLRQVRIGLTGAPLDAGEQRDLTYRVRHQYLGPLRPPRPDERRHRANRTPALRSLAIRVSFAAPGFTVRRCTWFERHAEPYAGSGQVLIGGEEREYVWEPPGDDIYGVAWELPR